MLAGLAIVLLPLGYALAYLWQAEVFGRTKGDRVIKVLRVVDHPWQVPLYAPGAAIESWLWRCEVEMADYENERSVVYGKRRPSSL
jgi:hypothetical protein